MTRIVTILTSPFRSIRKLFQLVVAMTLALGLVASITTFATTTTTHTKYTQEYCNKVREDVAHYSENSKIPQNLHKDVTSCQGAAL
jgi:hypothetical protein